MNIQSLVLQKNSSGGVCKKSVLFLQNTSGGCFCFWRTLNLMILIVRERCPNTEFFLVCIWTLFTQCHSPNLEVPFLYSSSFDFQQLLLFKIDYFTAPKKLSFPLRISLVNVTKSAISCGFGLIY